MTKASKKPTAERAAEDTFAVFAAFDALVRTASVTPDAAGLARDGVDGPTLDAGLTDALSLAHDRWGLGLQHLRHAARVERGEGGADILLLADGREITRVSQGAAAISATYEAMRALGDGDLSEWGVLPDGFRAGFKSNAQLRVLIEDARDFETRWHPDRAGVFTRVWRAGDVLAVEAHRPASPATTLADAAWDAITQIRDRGLQRELMERSNSVGMLGALLGARHKNAAAALERLPEAHFTVRSAVVRSGEGEARDFERVRAMLKEALTELETLQQGAVQTVANVLRHGLT